MKKEEAKILHGLYYARQVVGEEMIYISSEINWLAKTSISKGREWRNADRKLKSIEEKCEDWFKNICATDAAVLRPLSYLQASGYITFKEERNGFRITVTGTGADLARELDTFWGRANILYKNHKDGVIWFLAIVLVSLITTLIANGTLQKIFEYF